MGIDVDNRHIATAGDEPGGLDLLFAESGRTRTSGDAAVVLPVEAADAAIAAAHRAYPQHNLSTRTALTVALGAGLERVAQLMSATPPVHPSASELPPRHPAPPQRQAPVEAWVRIRISSMALELWYGARGQETRLARIAATLGTEMLNGMAPSINDDLARWTNG